MPTSWREELIRVDHNINDKNRLTFRYIHDSWNTVESSTIWTGSSFPTVQTLFNGPGVSMVARLTSTISPTLLNEFVASYTTDHISFQSDGAWQRPADLSNNMGSIFNNGFGGKLPAITLQRRKVRWNLQGPGWHLARGCVQFQSDLHLSRQRDQDRLDVTTCSSAPTLWRARRMS